MADQNQTIKKFLTIVTLTMLSFSLHAQSTWTDVYNLMQTNCTQSSCHNNSDVAGGLDLQGTGANQNQQQSNTYNNIYFATPNNSFAQSKHYRIAYPGNPYESSDDEMMLAVIMYTYDTTGLGALNPTGFQPVPINSPTHIYPNPMDEYLIVDLSGMPEFKSGTLTLFDLIGRKVKEVFVRRNEPTILYRDDLLSGIYFYQIADDKTVYGSGKIIIR